MRIASWAETQYDTPLDVTLDRHLRRMILDYLSGAIAGSETGASKKVGLFVTKLFGDGDSTALGKGPMSSLGAAILNGTYGHAIESDDGYTPGGIHPSAVVLPAAFAAGEAYGKSFAEIRTASAIGMEICCRIAEEGHPETRRNHFHNTSIAGVFGAAIAAGCLMELNVTQLSHSLAIASSHSSGLFEFLHSSAEVKHYHPGMAARDGIVSAELAAAGMTGPATAFEGSEGYFSAFAGRAISSEELDSLLDSLGSKWSILSTYFKPYPCCRQLHGPIDAALALKQQHSFETKDISAIKVDTFRLATKHDSRQIDSPLAAQMSIPFTVALALSNGKVDLPPFFMHKAIGAEMRRLMDIIDISVDEQAEMDYPDRGRPAQLNIELSNGQHFWHRITYPTGEPDNPLSDFQLDEKVHGLIDDVIGTDAATDLILKIRNEESLNFIEIADRHLRNNTDGEN